MTNEKLFFDTDCLSSFLWVKNENILVKLYGGRIILPKQVYDELNKPYIPHIKDRTNALIKNSYVSVEEIILGTEEYRLYIEMTYTPQGGYKIIGKGEAAAISLAVANNGILASNNLRDVSQYINKYNLLNITTGDILFDALNNNLITESQGNKIWIDMLNKARKLPTSDFTTYLKLYHWKIIENKNT